MTTTSVTAHSRLLGIDAARGVALFGMFVAHTAPSAGPAGILMVSEYFPFPLFVMLLGAGSELVGRRMGVGRHAAEATVRAICLILVGWCLTLAHANVYVVLGAMGVAMALSWILTVLRSWALVAVAAVGLALTERWNALVSVWRTDLWTAGHVSAGKWLDLVFSPVYPVPFVLACASLGVLGVRWLHPEPRGTGPSRLVVAGTGGALVLLAGALLVAARAGLLEAGADSWEWPTVTVSLALAGAAWLVSELLVGLSPTWTVPLHVTGTMSFTVYSLHVLWLGYWAQTFRPGVPDDAWVNVVGLSVGAIVLALAWRALRIGGRWWRGPIEGVVGTLAAFVGSRVQSRGPHARGESVSVDAR